MSNSSTISSKGQVTVPQEIRKRLGLEPGDRVEFVVEEGRTAVTRLELTPAQTKRAGEIIASGKASGPVSQVRRASGSRSRARARPATS